MYAGTGSAGSSAVNELTLFCAVCGVVEVSVVTRAAQRATVTQDVSTSGFVVTILVPDHSGACCAGGCALVLAHAVALTFCRCGLVDGLRLPIALAVRVCHWL